jgi:fibronectin type 3 domain-containing protein
MNLVATAGVAQVGLTWQTPSSIDPGYPITNYKVYRGTAPGTAIFLVDAGDVLSYTDTAVMAGQRYYYQVSAENSIDESSRSNEDSATPTATAADPSISIVEPTAGATVGTVVFLQVQITGFIIDAENVGQANVPGRGHYHVTVDGTTIDFMVTGLIYAVKDLTEGQHTIRVSLHNNDHSALTPEVGDEVTVNVAAPAPPPAGIDPVVFAGTTIGLIVLLIVVAVALILWGRRGRRAP